jgi:DNA-binding CsgD family transcriptional regulator
MDSDEWLRHTESVLAERRPAQALHQLARALLQATHARVGVRVNVRVVAGIPAVDLSVHSRAPHLTTRTGFGAETPVPEEAWRRESLDGDHPFTRYYRRTPDLRPRSLDQVRAAGFELTDEGRDRMRRLGVTPHQLAIPLSGTPEAYQGWIFLSDEPYADLEVEGIALRQDLIVGLDRYVQGLSGTDQGANPGEDRPIPGLADGAELTAGQARVLAMMHAGLTAPAMAARLGISPRTVHKHQEKLYRKLGATDRLSAVLAAKRLGLLPDQRLDDLEPAGGEGDGGVVAG